MPRDLDFQPESTPWSNQELRWLANDMGRTTEYLGWQLPNHLRRNMDLAMPSIGIVGRGGINLGVVRT